MRVLILGIDALEYDLVKEWNLQHLLQKEHGKVQVPIYEAEGEPVTLVVWPCFITGAEPEVMGYSSPILYRQPLRFILDYLFYPIYSFIKENQEKSKSIDFKQTRIQKIISKLNYKAMKAGFSRYPLKHDIKVPTIFDSEQFRSIHLHIPVYDESHTLDKHCNPRNNVIAALSDKTVRKEFSASLQQEFDERAQEVFDILQQDDWDLFMQYFYVLDGIQHVFFKNKLKIMDYYMKFNTFVGEVLQKIPDDMLVLIISDHGQKHGLHTMYGFYSSNVPLTLDNPRISEFKKILEDKLSISRKKRENL